MFDAAGRRLRRLGVGDGAAETTTGEFRWDGRDDRGAAIPSGVYFVRMISGSVVAMTRVVKAM